LSGKKVTLKGPLINRRKMSNRAVDDLMLEAAQWEMADET
jgi:hypothetical protein